MKYTKPVVEIREIDIPDVIATSEGAPDEIFKFYNFGGAKYAMNEVFDIIEDTIS